MAKFIICGDLHAKWQDLNSVMKNVDFNLKIRYDAVIQVGDFGFYPQTFSNLDQFNIKYVKNKILYRSCHNRDGCTQLKVDQRSLQCWG